MAGWDWGPIRVVQPDMVNYLAQQILAPDGILAQRILSIFRSVGMENFYLQSTGGIICTTCSERERTSEWALESREGLASINQTTEKC